MTAAMSVRDLMTEDVISIRANEDLLTARELMWDHDIRHLPVVDDDNELIGLLSHRDLLQVTEKAESSLPLSAQNDLLQSTRVREMMVQEVATTEPDEDIRRAAQLMVENKFGCLPVVSGGRLAGIITESDFVRFLAEGE
jgi:CBS domain-containing membrane protein